MTFVGIVVARKVTWQFGALQLQLILYDHVMLNQIAASLIDGMSHVRVQLVGGIVFWSAIVTHTRAAIVAIVTTDVILVSATIAARSKFAAGHGNKWAMAPFDDLQVSYDETMVKGDGTESAEAILRLLHQLDSNLGDVHSY